MPTSLANTKRWHKGFCCTLRDARQIPLLWSWIVAVRSACSLKRPEGAHIICHSLLSVSEADFQVRLGLYEYEHK
jgi:hypothetical protein